MSKTKKNGGEPAEIAVVGEVDDWEAEVVKALLEVPPGGECVFYIDSAGGSVFGALAVLTLLRQRRLIGVRRGASANARRRRCCCSRPAASGWVTRYSTLLFHRMRWQSEKRVNAREAFHWAKHFEDMEKDIDDLQIRLFGGGDAEVREWTAEGRYVTGPQLVEAGLAEMLELG